MARSRLVELALPEGITMIVASTRTSSSEAVPEADVDEETPTEPCAPPQTMFQERIGIVFGEVGLK